MDLLSQPVPSPPVTASCSNESRMDKHLILPGGGLSRRVQEKDLQMSPRVPVRWLNGLKHSLAEPGSLSEFCLYVSSPILRRHGGRRDVRPCQLSSDPNTCTTTLPITHKVTVFKPVFQQECITRDSEIQVLWRAKRNN